MQKLIGKTGGVAIKRKKVTEEVDKRPLPPRVSNEHRIHELLRDMYGDRTFLDDVIREAGGLHKPAISQQVCKVGTVSLYLGRVERVIKRLFVSLPPFRRQITLLYTKYNKEQRFVTV